jgi:hypothetical protein
MKEQDIHSVLWQKRNELRITDDIQHDWLDMQAMLDAQIPVGNPPGTNGGSSGTGGLSGFSGFKLLSVLLATLGAAILIYFASHKGVTETDNQKKNVPAVTATNKNDRSTNSNNTNNGDSLSGATSSSGLSGTPSATTNPDKTLPGTASSSSANTTTGGNTIVHSRGTATRDAGTTNNALPANKAGANSNNHSDKAGETVVKNNKPVNNNGSKATASGSSLRDNKTNANATAHPIKGSSTVIVIKDNKLPKNLNKRSVTTPSSLSRVPHNDAKTTGPAVRLGRSGAGTIIHSSSTGHATISGNGLVRHGRNRPPHAAGGLSDNALSKLKGGRSSRKGKNNPLIHNGKPTGNTPNQYTGVNKNPGPNTIPPVKNNTDQNINLADAVQAKFTTEGYIPALLSPDLADKFKDQQSGSINNKQSNSKNSKLDWGILAGVNTAGSFTAKSQNANFYGSFPLDAFFGLFATYNFSDKWGVNLGIRGLNPQNLSGSYTHANESKIDTLQTLNISDSRKVYFVDVPLNLVFKPNQYLSIKAGPVFSLPVKQVNGISTFQTGKLKKDSLYYVKVTQTINATNYTQSINMGLSLGASAQTGRFIFDAAYIRGLKGLTVSSGLGSYTANNNSFLFTIGFKLNKLKK